MERLSFAGRVLALGLCLSLALILTWSYRAFSQEGSSKSSEAVEKAEAREVDTQKDRVIYLAPAKEFVRVGVSKTDYDLNFKGLEELLYEELESRGYKVLRPTSFYRALKEKGIPYEVFKEDPFVAPELLEEAGVSGVIEPVFGYEDTPTDFAYLMIRMSYRTLNTKPKFRVEVRERVHYDNTVMKILKRVVEEFDRSWKSYKNFEEVMKLNRELSRRYKEINKISK